MTEGQTYQERRSALPIDKNGRKVLDLEAKKLFLKILANGFMDTDTERELSYLIGKPVIVFKDIQADTPNNPK